jgi:ribose/xylose/arabinose/galactoside ABC-type transport system permease subunit
VWETILLLALAGVAFATYALHGHPLDLTAVQVLMVTGSVIGLLTLGAGLSLRAGAANLAIGPVMAVCGLFFARELNHGFWLAALVALGVAVGIGIGLAAVVTLLAVPGWAASLVAYVGILVWLGHLPPAIEVRHSYDLPAQAYYIFGAFAALAVVGGVLGAIRPIRRGVGRYRPVSDPADLRGVSASVMTGVALVGSCVFAAAAGVVLAMHTGAATASDPLQTSVMALGVALVGGTSVYGRRGGVFGTLLAVSLFTLASYYVDAANWRVDPYALIGGTLLLGLIVSRVVEGFGRPVRERQAMDESTSRWLEQRSIQGWADQMPTRTYELPRGPEVPRTPSAAWADSANDQWGGR